METDRQQLREEGTAAYADIQDWTALVGRGSAPPSPRYRGSCLPPKRSRLPGSGELPGSQGRHWQFWRLNSGTAASRCALPRCPAQLLEQTDLPARWAPGLRRFPSSRLGGDKSLEVNPRVLATGGWVAQTALSQSLRKTWQGLTSHCLGRSRKLSPEATR